MLLQIDTGCYILMHLVQLFYFFRLFFVIVCSGLMYVNKVKILVQIALGVAKIWSLIGLRAKLIVFIRPKNVGL